MIPHTCRPAGALSWFYPIFYTHIAPLGLCRSGKSLWIPPINRGKLIIGDARPTGTVLGFTPFYPTYGLHVLRFTHYVFCGFFFAAGNKMLFRISR